MANAKQQTVTSIAKSNITYQGLVTGELGETLQHLACRSLSWHLGMAIARHPVTNGYGLSKQDIIEGGEIAFILDGATKPEPVDLGTLVDGFTFLTQRLEELALFEDYDPRTGAPTLPFSWYAIPTIESYIRNSMKYRANRVNTTRLEQAKVLEVKGDIPITDVTSEVDELTANGMAVIKGVYDTNVTLEDLEEALSDLKFDALYIVHQSAVSMLDRARTKLMAGKSGYIDPEILAFARWTCRPQQGMQAPE